MPPLLKRKRATAIIEHTDGILLALMRGMAAALPGGGVKPGESDHAAVIREVREETGLRVQQTVLLFRYTGFANDHAVFWVVAEGHAQASEEVDRFAYYLPNHNVNVSPETKAILKRFYAYKATHTEPFAPISTVGTANKQP